LKLASEKDPNVRCIVLRGAGDMAFCSGQDLKEHTSGGARGSLKASLEKSYNPMIRRMRSMEKATMELAAKLACAPTKTIGLIKRTLNKALRRVFRHFWRSDRRGSRADKCISPRSLMLLKDRIAPYHGTLSR
jgi:enoyl-CoA hydratase/carnithine racemase